MQTRSGDENSVCLSLRLSVCQTRDLWHRLMEERSVQIFIPYETSLSLVFWEEEWLVGQTLIPEILGQLAAVEAKSPIFNRHSLAAPQP